jgi:hypothetical protein
MDMLNSSITALSALAGKISPIGVVVTSPTSVVTSSLVKPNLKTVNGGTSDQLSDLKAQQQAVYSLKQIADDGVQQPHHQEDPSVVNNAR